MIWNQEFYQENLGIQDQREKITEKFKTRHKRGHVWDYLTLIKECVFVMLCLSTLLSCGNPVFEFTVFGMGWGGGGRGGPGEEGGAECHFQRLFHT